MNLADAIRKAAIDGPAFPPGPEAPKPSVEGSAKETQVKSPTIEAVPDLPSTAVLGGNVVRIEIFMSAEQSNNLLRAIMSGQHSILTLAEAAHYLRVRPQTLAKMADDGELPAIEIDGKWRFLKNSLDEWLTATMETIDPEEAQTDVA